MPYLEDGETWSYDTDVHVEGMSENIPGHRKFKDYSLPRWAKHPLTHPFSGVNVTAKDYIYTAGDGLCNPLGWSIAHVGAKHGDIDIMKRANEEELSRKDAAGQTPATYAVLHGNAWILQYLVEVGADTTSADKDSRTPSDHITRRDSALALVQQEWMAKALAGNLTEKDSLKAQDFVIMNALTSGPDPVLTERVEKTLPARRMFSFNMGNYEKPYPVPQQENRPLDLPSSKVEAPVKIVQPLRVALLFPGQGSQYVGMLKEHMDRPYVQDMMTKAASILGWDPADLMLNGPEDKLQDTRYCQPCLFIAGLAAMDVLKDTKAEVVERPQAVGGLSLGEYTALVAAGVLEFEDGLRLVKTRSEAMQAAVELEPQSMCSVAGLDRPTLDRLCQEAVALDSSPAACVRVSNWLFPSGYTCGGTKVAVDELCRLAQNANALQARVIKAGGAFHTELMQAAADELGRALDSYAKRMKPPRCAIYFNVTGKRVKAGSDPATFINLLKMQLTNEVLFDPIVRAMIKDGVADFYEVGPMKQIKAMIKRIDPDAFKRTETVSV